MPGSPTTAAFAPAFRLAKVTGPCRGSATTSPAPPCAGAAEGRSVAGSAGEWSEAVSELVLLARAWNFAAARHVDQKRKGEAEASFTSS